MRPYLIIAALSGFTAVLLGAMGSHFLSSYMVERGPEFFKTASLYHLIHSLALVGCALLAPTVRLDKKSNRFLKLSFMAFSIGIMLFSGTLYLVALLPGGPLHFLIPIGGLFFLTGWLLLARVGFSLDKDITP